MKRKVFVKKYPQEFLPTLHNAIESTFNGKFEQKPTSSDYEFSRFTAPHSVLVLYKSGKVVLIHKGMEEVEDFLISFIPEKEYDVMVGLDETGKGELFGNIVLCGVRIEKLKVEIEKVVSSFNTKNRVSFARYEELFETLKRLGVRFVVKEIEPNKLKPKKMNHLLFKGYLSILEELEVDLSKGKSVRIVLDDFGVSRKMLETLRSKYYFAELVVKYGADDEYLECKTASLVSKYFREKHIEEINRKYLLDGVGPGDGNLSDPHTKEWLRKWVLLHGSLPPFVKKWEKVLRWLDEKR
ncbi:MAG: hypothetical protein ABDH28_00200 [Brevinematia bacterium]